MPLDPVKIGYLRRAAPPGAARGVFAQGPVVAMLRKLVRSGHATEAADGALRRYARTPEGEAEIERFDGNLPPLCIRVMEAAENWNRHSVMTDELRRGLSRVMEGGLVGVGFTRQSGYFLTSDGERVLQRHRAVLQAGAEAQEEADAQAPAGPGMR